MSAIISPASDRLSSDVLSSLVSQVTSAVPPTQPASSTTILDVVLDPVTRTSFVIVGIIPQGNLRVAIAVPCGFPLIMPPVFPVSPVGTPPMGAIFLTFLNPAAPICPVPGTPFDPTATDPPVDLDALTLKNIKPVDMSLPYEQLVESVQAFNRTAQALQGLSEAIPAQVATQVAIPVEVVVAEEPEEIEIIVEEGLDVFDFELDITQ